MLIDSFRLCNLLSVQMPTRKYLSKTHREWGQNLNVNLLQLGIMNPQVTPGHLLNLSALVPNQVGGLEALLGFLHL